MASFMKPWVPETYAIFRIMFGLAFLFHGSQKLFGFPVPPPPEAPAFVIYGAGVVELFGGAMVALGLLTRWAAFLCSGTMAVAYWMAHGINHFLPIVNKGELALLYCFAFLFISAYGPGKWSIDGPND